jgi:hypothetical protein
VSRHKDLMFAASAALLALNSWLVIVRPRRCEPGDLCHVDSPSMRWNRRVFWFSVGVYVIAFVLTYGSEMMLSSS